MKSNPAHVARTSPDDVGSRGRSAMGRTVDRWAATDDFAPRNTARKAAGHFLAA